MRPHGVDLVPDALRTGEVSTGWGKVGPGLLEESLSRDEFRKVVHASEYYRDDPNRKRSGGAAGQLWRFIREMREGDLVVVPRGDALHVAKVVGPPLHVAASSAEHWAHRRAVEWLTGPEGVPRSEATRRLRTRLRGQMSCMGASDLIEDVRQLVG